MPLFSHSTSVVLDCLYISSSPLPSILSRRPVSGSNGFAPAHSNPQACPSPFVNSPSSPVRVIPITVQAGTRSPTHSSPHLGLALTDLQPLGSPSPCTAASTRPPCFRVLKHVILSLNSSTPPAPLLLPQAASLPEKPSPFFCGSFLPIHP